MIVKRALYPFGGLGGGAHGQRKSSARLFGKEARFEVIGGIDFEQHACNDFEYLADAPSWCTEV